jgi:hypothetical protein
MLMGGGFGMGRGPGGPPPRRPAPPSNN